MPRGKTDFFTLDRPFCRDYGDGNLEMAQQRRFWTFHLCILFVSTPSSILREICTYVFRTPHHYPAMEDIVLSIAAEECSAQSELRLLVRHNS